MANKTYDQYPSASGLDGSELVTFWKNSSVQQSRLDALHRGTGPCYVVNVLGDATTDETATINAAIAATAGSNIPIYIKANSSHAQSYVKITSTITFANKFQSVYMDGNTIFLWYGANDTVAVVIGDGSNHFDSNEYRINVHNSVAHGATGCTGIQVLGSHGHCLFYLRADSFTGTGAIGIQLNTTTSNGNGLAYNHFFLSNLYGNQCCLNIHEGRAGGFINQNIFHGGSFVGATGTSYGVLFDRSVGGYSVSQQNTFIAPSFEGCDYPVYFNDNGQDNRFMFCRDEANGANFFTVYDNGATPWGNYAQLDYYDNSITASGCAVTRGPSNPADGTPSAHWNIVSRGPHTYPQEWSSGKLSEKAFVTGTTLDQGPATFQGTSVTVLGAIMQATAGGADAYSTSGRAYIGKDSLLLCSVLLGWWVDCTYFKEFHITVDYPSGGIEPILFLGFQDSSGAWLDGANGYPSTQSNIYTVATEFNGHYGYTPGQLRFRVPDNAVKMRVGVGGSTTLSKPVAHVSSVYIRTIQNGGTGLTRPVLKVYADTYTSHDQFTCAASPAGAGSGYTPAGMIVGDNTGVGKGWHCTAAGYNARAWVASTQFYLDMLVTNGGNVYVCRTAGTSAGSGGPTGTGTGIADNTVVWDYVSNAIATWSAM